MTGFHEPAETGHEPQLRAKRLQLMTQDEAIVLMRTDCHVCKSEGLSSRARVLLRSGKRHVIATLYQVENDWLTQDEAGLSEAAWARLALAEGEVITVTHAPPLVRCESLPWAPRGGQARRGSRRRRSSSTTPRR